MKFTALFALIAVVSGSKVQQKESPDCPESTQVFSYNERAPAAAGLVQLEESPDCPESTQVFSYNERAPAAAGLVQLNESPDCPESTQVFSYNERAPAAAGLGRGGRAPAARCAIGAPKSRPHRGRRSSARSTSPLWWTSPARCTTSMGTTGGSSARCSAP